MSPHARDFLFSRIVILVFFFAFTFVLPFGIQQFIQQTNKRTGQFSSTTFTEILRLDSLPPITIKTGEEYSYALRYTYNGQETVTVHFESLPSWLEWDSTSNVLQGIVPEGVLSFTLKISVSAGSKKVNQDTSVEVVR